VISPMVTFPNTVIWSESGAEVTAVTQHGV
jgi:hypothetical protein